MGGWTQARVSVTDDFRLHQVTPSKKSLEKSFSQRMIESTDIDRVIHELPVPLSQTRPMKKRKTPLYSQVPGYVAKFDVKQIVEIMREQEEKRSRRPSIMHRMHG